MSESEEQVLARHKKELRDLVATTTGMKKQATKSKKKEVMRKIQDMEESIAARHKQEIEDARSNGEGTEPDAKQVEDDNKGDESDDEDDEMTPEKLLAQLELEEKEKEHVSKRNTQNQQQQSQEPKKKRNRQKEKLAKRDESLKKMQEDAKLEADTVPDLREIEMNNLKQLCEISHLKQYDITPDGHCLFASIADQLKLRHELELTVQELRAKAAEQIRKDPNTYIPFLFDERTMELRDVDTYTKEIEETAMWGGDLEILALSKEFNCPISVMMSGRATLKMNEEGQQPELKLVYYQHSFGLGEHYNSLRDSEGIDRIE